MIRSHVNKSASELARSIPTDHSKLYYPGENEANMASIFTAALKPSNEILGIHDLYTYAAANGSITEAELNAQQLLAIYLDGGASTFESMINHIAFWSWDCYAGTIKNGPLGMTKRNYDQSSTLSYTDKESDLIKLSTTRGRDRKLVASLEMSKYWPTNHVLQTERAIIARECHRTTTTTQYADQAQKIITSTCNVLGILGGLYDIGRVFGDPRTRRGIPALGQFANSQVSLAQITLGGVATLCTATGLDGMCYPQSAVWLFDHAEQIGNAYTVIGIVAGAAEGGPVKVGLDLACIAAPYAFKAYKNAATCCSGNCNSPACIAGSIACAVVGTAAC